jgi:GT2 family glycosyltransferase
VTEISVVIPTLGRHAELARALGHLDRQASQAHRFEVIVVADAMEAGLDELERLVSRCSYPIRLLQGSRAGPSSGRNVGWTAASSPLILFLDDDILAGRRLVAEHLDWHERHPDPEIGVLGRVRWARELRVTPFMRWLEAGVHFDYANIRGVDAGWGRFYTANASVKRSLLESAGGFDAERLPFGYEDLDLAYRMSQLGFRLLYNRRAVAEHLHEMTVDSLKARMPRAAASEHRFVEIHPEIRPYFHDLFQDAAARPQARGRSARLARFVPRRVPLVGPFVWRSADLVYRQALAPHFLRAWEAQEGAGLSGAGEAPAAT